MNRFAWILAVPYVVIMSTQETGAPYELTLNGKGERVYFVSKDVAYDVAAALNEAHEHRTILSAPQTWSGNPKKRVPSTTKFDYKSACGQSDCGADK